MPSLLPVKGWPTGRVADLFRRADHHRRVAGGGLSEPVALGRGQHLGGVEQFPRTGNEVVPRHGDAIVDVAVFAIKLRPEIR
jgi:hypothetical protein